MPCQSTNPPQKGSNTVATTNLTESRILGSSPLACRGGFPLSAVSGVRSTLTAM